MVFKKKSPNPRSVLFVCTANITRSPAAAALFSAEAEKLGEKWKVDSAGTRANTGSPPNALITNQLQKQGIQIPHRARKLDKGLLNRFRWIVVMERAHRDAILELSPDRKDDILLFRELANDAPPANPDVPDPTCEGMEDDFAGLIELLTTETPRVFGSLNWKAKSPDM